MYEGLDQTHFLAALLGVLIDQQGGIIEIDKVAFSNFKNEKFYAIKLDFVGDNIVLEVLDEDPEAESTGKSSD
jgi:hypothetical protein